MKIHENPDPITATTGDATTGGLAQTTRNDSDRVHNTSDKAYGDRGHRLRQFTRCFLKILENIQRHSGHYTIMSLDASNNRVMQVSKL